MGMSIHVQAPHASAPDARESPALLALSSASVAGIKSPALTTSIPAPPSITPAARQQHLADTHINHTLHTQTPPPLPPCALIISTAGQRQIRPCEDADVSAGAGTETIRVGRRSGRADDPQGPAATSRASSLRNQSHKRHQSPRTGTSSRRRCQSRVPDVVYPRGGQHVLMAARSSKRISRRRMWGSHPHARITRTAPRCQVSTRHMVSGPRHLSPCPALIVFPAPDAIARHIETSAVHESAIGARERTGASMRTGWNTRAAGSGAEARVEALSDTSVSTRCHCDPTKCSPDPAL